MKWIILLLTTFSFSYVLANEVKIELNPPRPVAGEVFQVYFRIYTDSGEEPTINFSPSRVEVVDKSNQGVSTRTIYANGKLSVTREMTFVYDMVANTVGFSTLRDINIQLGKIIIKHPAVNIQVVKEAEEVPEVFVMADVPKKTIFIGEGIVVRYFLYSKVPVSNIDVKKYPQLNNFLKRFLQEPDRSERVSVDGQIYLRSLIYAAKLFPEKPGELRIDPLQVTATYAAGGNNDPFARFGLSRNLKTKSLSSELVKVQVLPLPEPVPPHFIGLVGKHDIQAQFGQTRLIVNEPLEITLTISGEGALENLEAPEIIKHPGLEEFESNGDLKLTNADLATKTFNYTFLAKENFQSPSKTQILSYLDPNTQKYMPVQITIPEIVVAGGSAIPARPEQSKEADSSKNEKQDKPYVSSTPLEISNPLKHFDLGYQRWLPYLNLGLAALAVIIALGWVVTFRPTFRMQSGPRIPSSFKSGKFHLPEFVGWITPIIQTSGKTPQKIIHESPLTAEAKSYFADLLQASDNQEYSVRKTQLQFTYRASYFKELGRYIASQMNEDSSKPS